VSLDVQNAGSAVTDQIASLRTIIRSKPSAILVDAASPTALNATVQQACNAGILVFSYDQIVTAPCAYKLLIEDNPAIATDMLTWLATKLHGKGNILMDYGFPGVQFSTTLVSTWHQMLKTKYPGIHIVGTYTSQINPAVEQQQLSTVLAAHRNINGILSQAYCSSQLSALKQANLKKVPMTCLAVNGNATAAANAHVPAFMFGAPAWVGGLAIERAVMLLEKTAKFPKTDLVWNTNFVTKEGNVSFAHKEKVAVLKPNVNYFPTKPAGLVIPVTYGAWKITPSVALSGK
jgi:ribose transport system substrate-binding protein